MNPNETKTHSWSVNEAVYAVYSSRQALKTSSTIERFENGLTCHMDLTNEGPIETGDEVQVRTSVSGYDGDSHGSIIMFVADWPDTFPSWSRSQVVGPVEWERTAIQQARFEGPFRIALVVFKKGIDITDLPTDENNGWVWTQNDILCEMIIEGTIGTFPSSPQPPSPTGPSSPSTPPTSPTSPSSPQSPVPSSDGSDSVVWRWDPRKSFFWKVRNGGLWTFVAVAILIIFVLFVFFRQRIIVVQEST